MALEAFGERLKVAIKRKFKFQKEFVALMGIREATVISWVKGKSFPDNIEAFKKISDILDVSMDWLLFGKESSELDYNLFNEVTKVTYNWAKEKKVPINGTLFTGVYKTLIEERKHNKNITIQAILDKYEPLLQAIRGE